MLAFENICSFSHYSFSESMAKRASSPRELDGAERAPCVPLSDWPWNSSSFELQEQLNSTRGTWKSVNSGRAGFC
jgi:hypothetical protein